MSDRIIVLLFGGRLRAGKDAAVDRLVAEHGFVKLGMSDALLDHMLILDPFIPINAHPSTICPDAMEGTFVRASRMVAEVGYVEAKKNPFFRDFLLMDGTEGGRDFHYEDIWTDKALKTIQGHIDAGRTRIALTGVRFPNELAISERIPGARTVWVERPGLDSTTPAAGHASENSVDATMFDDLILNDGTLPDLHRIVDNFIEEITA